MSNLSNQFNVAVPATTTSTGTITLAADLGGTPDAPKVIALSGVGISGTPAAGYVLTASTQTAATWSAPAGSSSATKRVVTATFATTLTPNSATTDIYRVVLTANATLATPTGTPTDGQQLQVHFIQDGTGGRTITYASGYSFSTDIPSPTLSTGAGATDILGFQYSAAAGKWRLLGLVRGF